MQGLFEGAIQFYTHDSQTDKMALKIPVLSGADAVEGFDDSKNSSKRDEIDWDRIGDCCVFRLHIFRNEERD